MLYFREKGSKNPFKKCQGWGYNVGSVGVPEHNYFFWGGGGGAPSDLNLLLIFCSYLFASCGSSMSGMFVLLWNFDVWPALQSSFKTALR